MPPQESELCHLEAVLECAERRCTLRTREPSGCGCRASASFHPPVRMADDMIMHICSGTAILVCKEAPCGHGEFSNRGSHELL